MTNVNLCKEVADWAETAQHAGAPVAFDMGDWITSDALYDCDPDEGVPIERLKEGSCGTAACVAGYVALMRAPKGTTTTGDALFFPDGSVSSCAKFATRELGITADQAAEIFYKGNDTAIARLRYLAEHPDADPFALSLVYP